MTTTSSTMSDARTVCTIAPIVAASLRAGRHTEIAMKARLGAVLPFSVNAFIQSG